MNYIKNYIVIPLKGKNYVGLYGNVVLPEFRRRGYGREMLEWRMAQYPGRDFLMHIQPPNTASLNMAIDAGFRPAGYKKPWICFVKKDSRGI